MSNNIRIEEDLLGTRGVPADAYYDVYVLRAIKNFYISSNKTSDTPESVRGMVMVKKAATMANKELQTIPRSVANAIIAVCDEVLNNGRCMDQFPVNAYWGGAGTPVDMNTNEVLANIGPELMGHQKDEYQYLNLNDRVSKCQSTDDAYPTGFRITVCFSLIRPVGAINQLREGFERKAIELQGILKMSHIQPQDAIPTTLGQESHAFSISLKEEVKSIQRTAELLLEVSPGTTAVGTGLDTPKECSPLVVKKLAEVAGFPCVPAEDLIEATFDCGAYAMVRGALKRLAVKMSKICNDLRLFSSGPRTDLNEINLPELQAGSSIMPAKVNPVVPEVVSQVCFRVVGNDITVTMAAEADQLQLNVTEPVTGQAMLESVYILTNACYNLLEECIDGITTNKEVCEGYVRNPIGIVTHLNPLIGHHNGDIVGKICAGTGKSIHEVVLERGLLTEAELDDILSVQNLMHLVCRTKRYIDESEQQSYRVVQIKKARQMACLFSREQ